MPPIVASCLTLAFMAWLFRREFREKTAATRALWLPTLWVFLVSSKSPTKWLRIAGLPTPGGSMEEGNPLDAIVFLILTLAGLYVLSQRRVRLAEIVQANTWLIVFLLYCFIAILWSEFPFVAFKRWIKIIGHPTMALVIFSEPDPKESLVRLMKRVSYVMLPVSILWMKYYPALGRTSSEWGGQMGNCGIAGGKNALGCFCMLAGIFFTRHLLQLLKTQKSRSRRRELQITLGLLFLVVYCLAKAHSATSWIALQLGLFILVFLGLRSVNKRAIGVYAVAGVVLLVIAQLTFDIFGSVVEASGHGATLEGRGKVWQDVLAIHSQPLFGAGFESFWTPAIRTRMHEGRSWWPSQAHNGYLETYLNLGAVGLFLLVVVLFATFRKLRLELQRNFELGRLQMSYLAALLAHNWTEAGFRGLSIAFFTFFLVAVKYSKPAIAPAKPAFKAPSQREPQLASSHARAG